MTESRFTPSSLFLISITFTRASTFPRTSGSCGIEQSRRHCVVASFGESGSILSAEFIYSPHFVEYTNTTMDSTPPRLMSAVQYVYRGNLWEAQHKLRLLAFKITNPEIKLPAVWQLGAGSIVSSSPAIQIADGAQVGR